MLVTDHTSLGREWSAANYFDMEIYPSAYIYTDKLWLPATLLQLSVAFQLSHCICSSTTAPLYRVCLLDSQCVLTIGKIGAVIEKRCVETGTTVSWGVTEKSGKSTLGEKGYEDVWFFLRHFFWRNSSDSQTKNKYRHIISCRLRHLPCIQQNLIDRPAGTNKKRRTRMRKKTHRSFPRKYLLLQ
jgi:hypothetical protein